MKSIRLQYFALLREQAGTSDETVETDASDATSLFEELRQRHGFSLSVGSLQVAINGHFREKAATLHDGDEVVFIPPVAGG